MRKCAQYSAAFKEKLLAKVFSPNTPGPVELARRAGVPYGTLYTWINRRKKMQPSKPNETPMRPKDKTSEAKLQAVFDTLRMTAEEQGKYCRQHGLYTHHLAEWKKQILEGLEPPNSKKDNREYQQLKGEHKKLQRELSRKEKALVEASALLLLKKKANLIWGDGEDD